MSFLYGRKNITSKNFYTDALWGHLEVIVLQFSKLNLTSTAGRMMLTMLEAEGEMQQDLLVQRSQAGLFEVTLRFAIIAQ